MLFLQIKSLKCRHPLGVVVALAGNHRPPGERPVSLLGFRLAARASTLFCLIRPGRANRQNSPARASDEAGPTAILALRDASVRSFVPSSAASCRMAVGPVSPDARAAFASGCCAPCLRPERATPGQTGKIWPGGHFSSPPSWARGASVLFAVLRILHRFALRDAGRALPVAAIKSSQQLFAVGASLRVGRSINRLGPIASSNNRLRPIARAPHPATTQPLDDKAVHALPLWAASPVFAKGGHQLEAGGASLLGGKGKQRLLVVCLKAASGFWPLAAFATPSPCNGAKGFASYIRLFPKCRHWPRPTFGGLASPAFRKGLGMRSKAVASSCLALPYLRWARWHDSATA